MKIVDLKTDVLSLPLAQRFGFSMGVVQRRSAVIVELCIDDGVTGWGEALCHGVQPPQIAAAVVHAALKPIVLGQDPFDVDVLWERMYKLTRPFGQKGAVPNAISAVDNLQPDLCAAGGFTECRKISALALALALALAQAWHLPIVPHVWGSGIALAASLQFIATLPLALHPVEPMLEFDQSDHPFRQALIHDAIGLQNGRAQISDGPGLGVDINREVLARYASA